MLNCQLLKKVSFSNEKSKARVSRIQCIIGEAITKKIIAFAFYLLGGNRREISKALLIPQGTFLSFLNRFSQKGTLAFINSRSTQLKPINETKETSLNWSNIKVKNDKQKKVFYLTLLENNIITTKQASSLLDLSESYIRNLSKKLNNEDITCLNENRRGQQNDYVFTPKIKSELITQFIINTSTNTKTSGKQIALDLKERSSISVSDRSVRLHLSKLGLINAKKIKEIILKKN